MHMQCAENNKMNIFNFTPIHHSEPNTKQNESINDGKIWTFKNPIFSKKTKSLCSASIEENLFPQLMFHHVAAEKSDGKQHILSCYFIFGHKLYLNYFSQMNVKNLLFCAFLLYPSFI